MSELTTSNAGLGLLADLEANGHISQVGLKLSDPDIPYEQLEALARMFGRLHRTSQWLIGDLLNYVEKVRGETYAQLAEATGLAPQTLMNYCSICGRVPLTRRRIDLPFALHAEIAKRPAAEQKEWLKKAAANQWSRSQLRDQLHAEDHPGEPLPALPTARPATLTALIADLLAGVKETGDPYWVMVSADSVTRLQDALG